MEHGDEAHFAADYPMAPLEDDCKLMGQLLDDCLRIEVGEELFQKCDRIRTVAQCASALSQKNDVEGSRFLASKMADELMSMPMDEAMPLTRACGHYLNLTGIAEQHHSVRTSRMEGNTSKTCDEVFAHLLASGVTQDELFDAVCKQSTEIVLTAHPTQVNRRTLQHKHTRIAALLAQNDRTDLTTEEKEQTIAELVREITSLWQTDELRRRKPTPLDEARGGLHIVEQSLWAAMPAYLRRVSAALKKHTGRELPIGASPITFGSWMGGDRDGNPNVTAKVTHNVACVSRWMAADLYLREVDVLRFELSQSYASDEVWRMAREITEHHDHEDRAHAAKDAATKAPVNVPYRTSTGPVFGVRRTDSAVSGMSQSSSAGALAAEPARASPPVDTTKMMELPMLPRIAPFVNDDNATYLDIGSPPSQVLWSPPKTPPRGSSPDIRNVAPSPAFKDAGKRPFSVGFSLPHHSETKQTSTHKTPNPVGRVDSSGQLLSPDAIKRRGLKAASFHKTSIDALLHPRHAGATPYRIVLGDVRQKLVNTRKRMEDILAGAKPNDDEEWYDTVEGLAEPLLACYWSLWECGGGIVADGRLLDLLRRLYTFGISLMKMDLRQEASRHTEALDAITQYLDMGSYAEWDEAKRVEWLTKELEGKRPLIPPSMPMTSNVKEVIDTFRIAAELGDQSLGAYVISMATNPSDVLAVELLKREAYLLAAGEGYGADSASMRHVTLRVVPLFETLSDLDVAAQTMRTLFSNSWYRETIRATHDNHQEVMLGYSDSGKDAGRLAAAWALYKCQEAVVEVCKEFGIRLTLFHGRGGTVGRGGGPMYLAIQSQPPGSVQGSLRITEQGEMVQAKFGIPAVAERQLEIYTTAVLLATEHPPKPARHAGWRELMEELSVISCKEYRSIVFKHEHFISYFRHATPEEELVNLNIGSRPARRGKGGGVETLRAIPWIFAWTQTRMVLPAWLGIGCALEALFAQGKKAELQAMYQEWPFFQSTLDLIEMILAKADMRIASLYDDMLVERAEEKALGQELRNRFMTTVHCVLEVTGHQRLCQNNPTLRRLIEMRNPFIDPVNILQVEVLRRLREEPDNQSLRDALLITINGIAAGMRNTG
ncbi:hypothetical protein WJX72_001252 [[Myrmecia] bisecta]|uniref:phosphoenolpyruvate carboxylase n=1 Tax=[Myrmecia] bisecta TaxID=41462 RepID=A0AAW1QP25_9CHLO